MIPQLLIFTVILAVALFLFARERIPAEVTALGILLALVFTRMLPADRAFEGFGSDTVIAILGLLILTSALQRTGVVEVVGTAILRRAGSNPNRLILVVLVATALVSAFISNTAATAFFLPVVFGIAQKARTSPSRILLPMAFASILSSSVTLVSTSTNLVVSGVLGSSGMAPLGMFELTPVGIPIALTGLAYVFLVRRWVPDRGKMRHDDDLGKRLYLSNLVLLPEAPLAGKTLAEARLPQERGLRVLRISRGGKEVLAPDAETVLESGDILTVEGSNEDIVKVKTAPGLEIMADVQATAPGPQAPSLGLAQGAILPGSHLIGRTIEDYALSQRYGVQILALNDDTVPRRNILRYRMRLGDVLLLQGQPRSLARLQRENIVRILGEVEKVEDALPRHRHAPIAGGIFAVVLLLAALNVVTLPVATMLGAFLVFITRCITPSEAYDCMEWKAILLIGSMLSLGTAMEHTGIANFAASHLIGWLKNTSPGVLLSLFFVLTVLLTQPMSNQAAAIVILPIALATATQLGLNPRSFAVMIAVAASCSYLTPLEPSCMMVYGPGHYRFMDFLKIGAPLTVLVYAIAILLVPRFWPVIGS
jgi:di/tricarboxylate transporter